MATLEQKIAAELKVRELLGREGVPEPDRVEYGYTCIRLYWNGPKVALVVDFEEFADDLHGAKLDIDVFPREGKSNARAGGDADVEV